MATYTINQFNGGIGDSKFLGIAGSCYLSERLDLRKEPGVLQIAKGQPTLISMASGDLGITICNVQGSDYFFLSTDNYKLWRFKKSDKSKSAITATTPFTFPPTASKITDIQVFNERIYFNAVGGAGNGIYHISVTNATTNTNWDTLMTFAGDLTENPTQAPMIEWRNNLLVGNGRYLRRYSGTSSALTLINATALTLPYGEEIFQITEDGQYIRIYTKEKGNSTNCHLYLWDGIRNGYNESKPFPALDIKSVCNFRGTDYIFTDNNPLVLNIGQNLQIEPFKTLPIGTSSITMARNASDVFNRLLCFGISSSDSNLAGVWTWGNQNLSMPKVLNKEFQSDAIDIGVMQVIDGILWYSTKEGSNYEMYWVDTSLYNTGGFWISRVLPLSPHNRKKTLRKVSLMYSYPSGSGSLGVRAFTDLSDTSIDLSLSSSDIITSTGANRIEFVNNTLNNFDFNFLQLYLTFGSNSPYTVTPKVYEIVIEYEIIKEM